MLTVSEASATIRQGWRFGTGLRRFLRDPVDPQEAHRTFADDIERREERFLSSMDRLVWAVPSSPYLPLLEHASLDRTSLRSTVQDLGLEVALELLRDRGVYVSYEEFLGNGPIRRGDLELRVTPASFHNPTIVPDYLGSTGGTRSGGTSVAISFADRQSAALRSYITRAADGVDGPIPAATWLPCLPSAAGLGALLTSAKLGSPPERWFSQIPTSMEGVPRAKRITNELLPLFGRAAGSTLPRPEHVPTSGPAPVLEWCTDALSRSRRAVLATYPSSAVRLADLAVARGVSLDGLLIFLLGEPATIERRLAVERSGARTVAGYAFMQLGGVGYTCPLEVTEDYHAYEGKVAVITRRRARSDGEPVDAFLWTSLLPTSRGVFLNVENDDYGAVTRDERPCECLYGQLGSRTRIRTVRGMSKVVAAGVTVRGEVFERLVDHALPRAVGGTPAHFQFAEHDEGDQTALVVRVDPAVGAVDDSDVVAAISAELRREQEGALADEVWVSSGSFRVVRQAPVAAKSGKTLAFEPLDAPAAMQPAASVPSSS